MCISKKLTVGFLAIVLAFTATSCSTSETEMEMPKQALLKKAILKRNAAGEYSVEYVVADQTVSDQRKESGSSNEFHLSKVAYNTENTLTEDLVVDKNNLEIDFIDEKNGSILIWSIEDENIKFAKGETQADNFLKSYSLMKINGDDAVQLSFEVQDNVSTEFIFNEEAGTYEVHLRELTSSTSNASFDRNLTLLDTGVFKLDFVSHTGLTSKVAGSRGNTDYTKPKPKRKPRIIMQLAE